MFVTADAHLLVNAMQATVPGAQQDPDNATFDYECKGCGAKHKLYAKLKNNDDIDKQMQAQGFLKLPKDGKFRCPCGVMHDLSGAVTAIETQSGKKVI